MKIALFIFVGCVVGSLIGMGVKSAAVDCHEISANGNTWAETCDADQTIDIKPVEGGVLATCRCRKEPSK
jgi:hypothetical protein